MQFRRGRLAELSGRLVKQVKSTQHDSISDATGLDRTMNRVLVLPPRSGLLLIGTAVAGFAAFIDELASADGIGSADEAVDGLLAGLGDGALRAVVETGPFLIRRPLMSPAEAATVDRHLGELGARLQSVHWLRSAAEPEPVRDTARHYREQNRLRSVQADLDASYVCAGIRRIWEMSAGQSLPEPWRPELVVSPPVPPTTAETGAKSGGAAASPARRPMARTRKDAPDGGTGRSAGRKGRLRR